MTAVRVGLLCSWPPRTDDRWPAGVASRRGLQISDAHQIVEADREREQPPHARQAAVALLAHQRERLQPPEDLFDAFAHAQAGSIAGGKLRDRGLTPHVTQNTSGRRSALDARTTKSWLLYPLSHASVLGPLPGSVVAIAKAASRSVVPVAGVTVACTASPFRFSISTWPR